MARAAFVAVTAACLFGRTRPALAQGATDAQTQAKQEFETGRQDAARGDCEGAIPHFLRARALYATAGSLYNLADCEERLGKLTAAQRHWTTALAELKPDDPRAVDARGHLESLAQRIATVRLELPPGAPPDSVLSVDGEDVPSATLGVTQPLDPGLHVLAVRTVGRTTRSVTLRVAEGARDLVLRGELGDAPGAPPTSSAPAIAPSAAGSSPPPAPAGPGADPGAAKAGRRSTLAHVSGVIGLLGLSLSAVSGAVLIGRKSALSNHCDSAKVCDDEGLRASEGLGTWSALGTVGFGVGLVGVGGFFLLPRTQDPTSATARLGVGAGRGSYGAWLSGMW